MLISSFGGKGLALHTFSVLGIWWLFWATVISLLKNLESNMILKRLWVNSNKFSKWLSWYFFYLLTAGKLVWKANMQNVTIYKINNLSYAGKQNVEPLKLEEKQTMTWRIWGIRNVLQDILAFHFSVWNSNEKMTIWFMQLRGQHVAAMQFFQILSQYVTENTSVVGQ